MESSGRGILGFVIGCAVAGAGTSALWWVLDAGGAETAGRERIDADREGDALRLPGGSRGPAAIQREETTERLRDEPDVGAAPGPFGEEYWRWTDAEILEGWASVCEESMPAGPPVCTWRRRSAAAKTQISSSGHGGATLPTVIFSPRPARRESTRTPKRPGRSCTRITPLLSMRAGRSPETATGTASGTSAPVRRTSRAFPEAEIWSCVSSQSGIPSAR